MSANNYQVGGDHYTRLAIQPWDAMQAWLTPEEFAGFLKGNALKYLARHKPGSQDLGKALHYLEKALEIKEQQSTPSIDDAARILERLHTLSETVRVMLERLSALELRWSMGDGN